MSRLTKYKAGEDAEKNVREELLVKSLKDIEALTIEVKGKANDQGHLFAGLHKDEIAHALKEQGHFDIAPEYIDLDKPVKELGEHKISNQYIQERYQNDPVP